MPASAEAVGDVEGWQHQDLHPDLEGWQMWYGGRDHDAEQGEAVIMERVDADRWRVYLGLGDVALGIQDWTEAHLIAGPQHPTDAVMAAIMWMARNEAPGGADTMGVYEDGQPRDGRRATREVDAGTLQTAQEIAELALQDVLPSEADYSAETLREHLAALEDALGEREAPSAAP